MGRKSSAKSQQSTGEKRVEPKAGGPNPLVIVVILVAIVGIGLLAFWRPSSETPAAADAANPTGTATPPSGPQATPAAVTRAESLAKLGPRKQTSYPPIPFQPGFAPPRSTDVVTAAYEFAAEHPEVLSYVPCFCGCERAGHGGNHDCFVKARAENGDVVAWDEHGVDCAVCIDVATRSRQMHAAGAKVTDIRAAIDKEFGAMYPTGRNMPTPRPHATH